MPFLQRSSSKRANRRGSLDDRAKTEKKASESATANPPGFNDSMNDAMHACQCSTMDRPKSASAERRRLQRSRPPMHSHTRTSNDSSPLPKCSRDLEQQVRTIDYTAGPDIFSFPTPSPRMPPHSATINRRHYMTGLHPMSPGIDSPQVQSPAETPHIGIALGSPSEAPPTWGRSHTHDAVPSRRTAGLPPSRSPPPIPQPLRTDTMISLPKQKKISSWKTFSSLFRSKTTSEPSHKFRTQPPADAEPANRDVPLAELEADPGPTARSQTPLSCLFAPSPGMPKRRDSLDEAQSRAPRHEQMFDAGHRTSAVPRGLALRAKGSTPNASPKVRSHGVWRVSQDAFGRAERCDDEPMLNDEARDQVSEPALPTPRLDLDLPGVEFPRFSIMFEKQLSLNSRPSILERRQSRLQRSQSQKGGECEEGLQVHTHGGGILRSMTSPSFKRPLSILVKAEQAARDEPATALQRMRLPMRSVTAPVGTTSPIAAAFMQPRQGTHLSSSPESQGSAFYSENSLPPTPTTATTCTDTESARRMLVDAEPFWKPPAVMRSFSHPAHANIDHAFANEDEQAMSYRDDESYPRVKSPEDLERQMVQVSVARQVSVSRARTRVMKAMEGSARPAAVPLRPRIIEFSKNRKSAAGVLEDASADCEDVMPENAAAHSRAASLAFEEAKRRSVVSTKSAKSIMEQDVPEVPSLKQDTDNKNPVIMTADEAY
ncbi:hypothetical protein CB0940_06187 [Cercospora beticola]|uniref:Uncharacterized protein n=1 Tax=Cercospora beticola TaxID=122368 RepID=A0A2G5HXK3_CERBT|nr:hypothetical protein CB0940_06187 [Cercospora beticola]PIA97250.1 hypothetical protein CB0940_06187 [Cercospora beticola]WPA98803.1 hypothetical protein RHO25_003416 [Cercospora beticola]